MQDRQIPSREVIFETIAASDSLDERSPGMWITELLTASEARRYRLPIMRVLAAPFASKNSATVAPMPEEEIRVMLNRRGFNSYHFHYRLSQRPCPAH